MPPRTRTAAACLLACLMACSFVFADAPAGEIHTYCADAEAIFIGSPLSYSDDSAELKVEEWIKSAETVPVPATLRLYPGPGGAQQEDKEFSNFWKGGRFLVFVFHDSRTGESRTGDGHLGSIIEIGKDGSLPAYM